MVDQVVKAHFLGDFVRGAFTYQLACVCHAYLNNQMDILRGMALMQDSARVARKFMDANNSINFNLIAFAATTAELH